MGSCAAPSAKGDDKFITTDYLQQCPATRSGLESNEIAILQRSLPSRFNLRHLKKNESLKLVLQKKAGKSRVVAYKFTSGSFNYTAYRISDKKFYNLSDTSGKGSLDYPLPA
ncbi:TPA: hypothetical protein ACH7DO_005035, partial [Escherichia coli]